LLLVAQQQPTPLMDRNPIWSGMLAGEPDRMEGRRIDHYEVLRELGLGGMGSVYLAMRTDDVYRKPVALKVVRAEVGSHEVIKRFRLERRILAELDHPNLARLLDGGTTPEGLPYFVMDYVDGLPIDTYCDQHQLSVAERLNLFRSVCTAVEYAHRHGVAHRDLKPGNILVTAEGLVKLLDFGIAGLLGAGAEEPAAQITPTGMRLMTPEYASPEQVRGETAGIASDIYSLGVVLYELLTGHRPYRMGGRLIHEVVRVICEEEPAWPSTAVTETEQRLPAGSDKPVSVTPESISRARAATPSGLRRQLSGDPDKIVLKALRKNPAQRYRTAAEFNHDISQYLEGSPVLAQGQSLLYRAGKFLKRYRGWALVALLLSAGAATGYIKITGWVLYFLPPFLVALVVGYWQRRKELGRGFASKQMFPHTVFVIICVCLGFALFKLVPDTRLLLILGGGCTAAINGVFLIRWSYREQWVGPLLLDISRPRHWTAYIWVSTLAGALLLQAILHRTAAWTIYAAGMELFAVRFFTLWGRAEIHQRGILYYGGLLRWPRIDAYAWEHAGAGLVVLKLRKKGLAWFFPAQIVLPADQKGAAAAILTSSFPVGPARPSAITQPQVSD